MSVADDWSAALAGRLRAAEFAAVLDEAPGLGEPADPAALHHLAVAAYKLGRWERAREYLEQAILRAPEQARSHQLLGLLSLEAGAPDVAREHLDRWLELVPDSGRGHVLRALARWHCDDVPGAAADLERAIALEPGLADAHYDLGVVRARLGLWDEAARAFARFAELDRWSAGAVRRLFVEIGRAQALEQVSEFGMWLKDRLADEGDRLRGLTGGAARLDRFRAAHQRLYTELVGFLAAIRPEPLRLDLVDIHGLVSDCLQVARRSTSHLEITTALQPGMSEVVCDPRAVRQAFLNLILRAADIVPREGGRLHVATADTGEDEVFITVEDSGPEIDEVARARLFGLTAPGPNGEGVALFQVARAVERHGGRVRVERARAGGTRFVLALPTAPRARVDLTHLEPRSPLSEHLDELLIED